MAPSNKGVSLGFERECPSSVRPVEAPPNKQVNTMCSNGKPISRAEKARLVRLAHSLRGSDFLEALELALNGEEPYHCALSQVMPLL